MPKIGFIQNRIIAIAGKRAGGSIPRHQGQLISWIEGPVIFHQDVLDFGHFDVLTRGGGRQRHR